MPKINTPESGHIGPAALPRGHQYLSYGDAKFLATLSAAVKIIDLRIRGHAPCNRAFRTLPGGKTFAEIWLDEAVWLNFDPSLVIDDYGATRGKEVTITAFALKKGHWVVAATLIHELAHVNGAAGDNRDAESMLRSCLLKDLEDPRIIGNLLGPSNGRVLT